MSELKNFEHSFFYFVWITSFSYLKWAFSNENGASAPAETFKHSLFFLCSIKMQIHWRMKKIAERLVFSLGSIQAMLLVLTFQTNNLLFDSPTMRNFSRSTHANVFDLKELRIVFHAGLKISTQAKAQRQKVLKLTSMNELGWISGNYFTSKANKDKELKLNNFSWEKFFEQVSRVKMPKKLVKKSLESF